MDFIVNNALKQNETVNAEMGGLEVGHATIKVIGAGGAGCNMMNWLHQKGISGAEVLACNTDMQHLNMTSADKKFLLGPDTTRGLGAGGYAAKGREAAQESINQIKEVLRDADMCFVCAGMGGGTGTGSAPVVAGVAKEMGAIVIGTVTMPFKIERARVDKAEAGLQELRQVTHSVIVIDNNRLVQIAGSLPIQQAFAVANELIATMIKGIVETIAVPSLVNLDFADVKTIMTTGDVAVIGVGASDSSSDRVKEAVNGALSNPLLDVTYDGATGAIIHIHGGADLTLDEISQIGDMVTERMDEYANVIWGARISEEMKGKVTVMTIVTGVKSPWILGPRTEKEKQQARQQISNELGLEIVH